MTTLAANKVRRDGPVHLDVIANYKMVASDIIYEGAAVGDNGSGYARPLVAADPFLGFAVKKKDNSSGAAGDERVETKIQGFVELAVTGVTGVGDIGDDVYATDDDTFTKTSSGASSIGTIVDYISSTTVLVFFQGSAMCSI